MPTIEMTPRFGDFILSQASGTRSLENDIAASGAGELHAGTVLGKVTASGKYVQLDPAATDGSEAVAGLLVGGVDATDADADIVRLARDAEVKADGLIWPDGISGPDKATAIAELNALGIVLRDVGAFNLPA